MMTKLAKAIITIISIIMIMILLSIGAIMFILSEQRKSDFNDYRARRDELILQQERINELISGLNKTLTEQANLDRQLVLSMQALNSNNISTQRPVQIVTIPAPVIPTPVKTTQTPVTRAS